MEILRNGVNYIYEMFSNIGNSFGFGAFEGAILYFSIISMGFIVYFNQHGKVSKGENKIDKNDSRKDSIKLEATICIKDNK